MGPILKIAVEIVLIQICGAITRYIPFHSSVTDEERKNLVKGCVVLGILSLAGTVACLSHYGISVIIYKRLMSLGFLPFFLLSFYIIRRSIYSHIFVLGMQVIYYLLLQSLSTLAVNAIFAGGQAVAEVVICQAGVYLTVYILFFPLALKLFTNLLPQAVYSPSPQRRPGYRRYLSFLPLLLVLTQIRGGLQDRFISFDEMTTRWLLLLGFFIFYKFVMTEAKTVVASIKTEHDSQILVEQLRSMENYTSMLNEAQQQMAVIRHDFRHNLRMLCTLLESGQQDAALTLISSLEQEINHSAYQPICQHPLINAALSVYLQKAKEYGITVEHKVNLPADLIPLRDYSIVLANLLENAVKATAALPEEKRTIKITIQTKGKQIITSIINPTSGQLVLDNDGLPVTDKSGHGIGMISLRSFAKKNGAILSYKQVNDEVQFLMYFTGK